MSCNVTLSVSKGSKLMLASRLYNLGTARDTMEQLGSGREGRGGQGRGGSHGLDRSLPLPSRLGAAVTTRLLRAAGALKPPRLVRLAAACHAHLLIRETVQFSLFMALFRTSRNILSFEHPQ